LQSITATKGATIQGQLLARNGAVTLENNTINNELCATIAPIAATVGGGKLPSTSTPLYDLLLLGGSLTLAGVVGWRNRKRFV